MIKSNGYAAYANSKVATATPAELTLMLYDGAIKFCNIAIMALEEKDLEKAHNNIIKVENIYFGISDYVKSQISGSKGF